MSKMMKRLLCVLAVIIAVIGLSLMVFAEQGQEVQGPECYEHGDVNGDGTVNNKDAIYIMYCHMFGQESYPINQIWDYNEDGNRNNQDAIYIMYHHMLSDDPDFALKGTIHDYFDPSWVWDDATGSAQVTFKCGCGLPSTYTTANGVSVVAGQRVEPTCVAAGSQKYTASVTVDGKEYTNEYTKVLPAGDGHSMVGTQDCENGSYCNTPGCDYKLEAKGHKWVRESSVNATCTEDAYELYRCSQCQKTDKKVAAGTAAHSMQHDEDKKNGCQVTKWYKCTVSGCGHTAAGTAKDDVYYEHTYTAALTKDATCMAKGVKTYTCSGCGDSYTEDVEVNDSHAWVEGETKNGVTTHNCSRTGCTATKTTVVAANNAVSNEALKNNELQLQNEASMKLDEKTVEGLDQDKAIKVNVDVVDPEEAGLTQEQQAQVGNAKVYDFSMTYDDGEPVSQFEGEITISLPYTLEDGEDVDSINVWYIDDSGNPTAVKATYSNGFVTFTTSHFSYYTVTRLTAAERCELYGHVKTTRSKDATCTEDGYVTELCTRCGEIFKNEVKGRSGHNYQRTETKDATCTASGSYTEVCGNCNATITGAIPATGHDMKLDSEKSVTADCSKAGKDVYVCSKECGYTQEVGKAQLKHDYKPYEDIPADCENKGKQTKKCSLCNDVVVVQEYLPLGHNFETKNATWSWGSNNLSATVTLTCSNDKAHTKVLTAVVTEIVEAGNCEVGAGVTYTATAAFNKETFTDSRHDTLDAPGHTAGTAWESDKNKHYHICQVCEKPLDEAAHTWDDGKVIKEATCSEAGKTVYTCLVCAYEDERTVAASNEHNYQNGICTGCGREEGACNHVANIKTELNAADYGICEGGYIVMYSCECGQNRTCDYMLFCDIAGEEEQEGVKVEIDGDIYTRYEYACKNCGLTETYLQGGKYDAEACRKWYTNKEVISKGDFILSSWEGRMGYEDHPGVNLVETVDLSQYGICEVIDIYTCGCQKALTKIDMQKYCNWEWIGSGETPRDSIYMCADCGARRVCTYTGDYVDDCLWAGTNTYSYYMDDELVYTVTADEEYQEHYYNYYNANNIINASLLGEYCYDGVAMTIKCENCDAIAERTVYEEHYYIVLDEVIDLTNLDVCGDSIEVRSCLCGANTIYNVYSDSHNYCEYDDYESSENGNTQTWKYTCSKCGSVQIETETRVKEGCESINNYAMTWKTKDGKVLTEMDTERVYTNHNYEVVDKNFRGENGCEDGGWYKMVCEDCGDYQYGGIYSHMPQTKEEIELGCGGIAAYEECMCGLESDICFYNESCMWEPVAGDGDIGYQMTIYLCQRCGGIYMQESTTKRISDCASEVSNTYTFYKNQEDAEANITSGVFESTRVEYEHNMKVEFVLNNADLGCKGGYRMTETCRHCGKTEVHNYGADENHTTHLVEREEVAQGQTCGEIYQLTYSCACGKRVREEHSNLETGCQWRSIAPNTFFCNVCEVTREEVYLREDIEGQICAYKENWIYNFSKDGQELFTVKSSGIYTNHRELCTLTMEGDSCGRVRVDWTCADCDESGTYWSYSEGGHSTYPVEYVEVLDSDKLCGGVYLVRGKCACGENDSWDMSIRCDYNYMGEDKDGNSQYRCRDCGLQWTCKSESQRLDDSCKKLFTEYYTFTLDGETIEKTVSYTEVSHDTVARLNCESGNCENGYTGVYVCRYCGTVDGTTSGNDHDTHSIAYYDLTEYGMCGGYVYNYACACGLESRWSWDIEGCDFSHTGNIDPETGMMEYYCVNCSSTFSWGNTGELNPQTCIREGEFCFKLRKGDNVLLNLRGKSSSEEHNTQVVSATLRNPNGTCEEGVDIISRCVNCGRTFDGYAYNHQEVVQWNVETSCGGYAEYRVCACGESKDVSSYCEGMRYKSWEETDENGVVHFFNKHYCAICDLTVLYDTVEVELPECKVQMQVNVQVTYGDIEKSVSYSYIRDNHKFGDEVATLLPDADTCEDGVKISRSCAVCGYEEYSLYSSHYEVKTGMVDLKTKGACQGEYRLYACACGQENSADEITTNCADHVNSWEEIGADGLTHSFMLYRCAECGLEDLYEEYYESTDTACGLRFVQIRIITIGDYTIRSTYSSYTSRHDYQYAYEFAKEGITSCVDGVRRSITCSRCDYNYTDIIYDHDSRVTQTIDLSEYGAVCGAELKHYECLCGAYENWVLSEDHKCDLDRTEIEEWIEGDIDAWQPHMQDQYAYTHSELYRCAVTDPVTCGLSMGYARYWVHDQKNCTATQYEQWLLGYDPETGAYETKLEGTIDQKSWHDFEQTEITGTDEDGNKLSGYTYTCKQCGSSYVECRAYELVGNEQYCVYDKEIFTNTLNNAERKYRSSVSTYADISGGDNVYVCISYRYEYIEADGNEYWSMDEYTYDYENCERTYTQTDSNGDRYAYTEDCHANTQYDSDYKNSTCSQPGYYHYWYTCKVCDKISSEHTNIYEAGHDWYKDENTGIYVCDDCGLENKNGADGDIIMEDMTDYYNYSNGVDYIIGYYNPKDIRFEPNLTVILDDGSVLDVEFNEFVYKNTETDGYQGITFNAENADAAAKAAVDAIDYIGQYALRISFVPVGSGHELDYAITFDSVWAQ